MLTMHTPQVPALAALETGLVDHVVAADNPDLVQAAISFARGRVAGGVDALRTGRRPLKVLCCGVMLLCCATLRCIALRWC